MQSCCSSTSAPNMSAICACNALLCACPRVSQPEHPDRLECICSHSGETFCGAAKPANTQAARNHVEDRSQTESESLANKSRRLLTEIRNLDSIKAASEVASLMAADPAIVQVGTARGPSLEESSRRLLTLVENMAANPGSPGAVDPVILRMGPPRQVVREAASGGDHEVLQDAKNITLEQLDRLLLLKIQNVDRILEDLNAADPSIIRGSLLEAGLKLAGLVAIEEAEFDVTAYPSIGGIVLGHFTAVQLKQLNLSNLDTAVRSRDPADEDNLALAMMRQGAHWWPSLSFYSHHYERLSGMSMPYDFHFPPCINVGYPSSGKGVWVFKFSEDVVGWDDEGRSKPYLDRIPPDWYGTINLALTADERCEILKRHGATFYDDVEDCNDIPKTLEEGYQRGKRYEELLKRMEDDEYLDRWLGHGISDT
ncbi:hypothetical protein DL770_010503 [Monosporascus sp. CRB-9-2]|nr:hypothetical protein DL770_010503 [Monosporascus sp. CRB-9-2]